MQMGVHKGSTDRMRRGAVAAGIAIAGVLAALIIAYATESPRTAQAAPPEPCSSAIPTYSNQVIERLISRDPSVSVQPNLGPSGTQAQLHVWNFLPSQAVSAIFRVTGDPVVATGTTDANGEAYLNFTVPQAANGTYWILVAQENRTCVHAAVHFTIGPLPAVTPTTPPTVVPPTPTVPPPTPAISPTAPPQPPVAGSGNTTTSLGVDSVLAGAAFFIMASGFAILTYTQRKRQARTR